MNPNDAITLIGEAFAAGVSLGFVVVALRWMKPSL